MDAAFDFNKARKKLFDCVDEMYLLEKGVLIARPDEIVMEYQGVRLSRKQAKHIVEQRKSEGKSKREIKRIFDRLPKIIADFDFEIWNQNQKHEGSVLRVGFFKGRREGTVIVMGAQIEGHRNIITTYQCRLIYAYLLLLKKLNASAAGKTPDPKDILMG